MGSNATASTAAASGGVAGAIVVIFVWVLALVKVVMPADVAAAMMVVTAAGIHAGVLKLAFKPVTDTTAIVPGNPSPVVATVKKDEVAEPKAAEVMPPLSDKATP